MKTHKMTISMHVFFLFCIHKEGVIFAYLYSDMYAGDKGMSQRFTLTLSPVTSKEEMGLNRSTLAG